MLPIVVHVPHSSSCVPAGERASFSFDDAELDRELLRMTDAWTDELLQLHESYSVRRVVAGVSRLVCDVERYRDDATEPMAAIGMGALYTHDSNGQPYRWIADADRRRLLTTYYDPHHASLTACVDEALEEAGSCVIIDVHSFPSRPLPYERDQTADRPQICIGFEGTHGRFLDGGQWEECCRWAGFVGEANRPFSGSIVPAKYLGNENVMSAMIEVRRDLYMDETTGEKLPSFGVISRKLGVLGVAIASSATRHCEYLRKLRVPYGERLPLLWAGKAEEALFRMGNLLGATIREDAETEAKAYVEGVESGRVTPFDRSHIPRTPEESAHLLEYKRREYLADALRERIFEEGEVVDEYCYDGLGEETSPGSSFHASVRGWKEFYIWVSEVESDGPFASLEEATAGMRRHCGLEDDDEEA